MHDTNEAIAALGNEPPLTADGRSGPPDRREVSARWLSGTFLTGLTSSVLMGVALFAALDGREQLATPPEIARPTDMNKDGVAGQLAKTARLAPARQVVRAKDRRRMEVSTVSRVGDRDVIRTVPCRISDRPQLSTVRSPFRFCRGRRCPAGDDRTYLWRQGRERNEPQDPRFPDRDRRL